MKKLLFVFCSFISINLFAQAWDIAALGIYAGLNASFGEKVEMVISPYMNCCLGEEVTLLKPDYLYKRYNWRHEEGKGEIDTDEWWMYINRKYTITRIGYGAEAGFFQYGVVFELTDDEKSIYAIISNLHIANNDALSTIFKESLPCPEYYRRNIYTEVDPFTDELYSFTSVMRLSDDDKVFIATGKSKINNENCYRLILHVGSNTEKTGFANCILVLSDGKKIICESQQPFEKSYVDDDNLYKMYYSAKFAITEEQINQLANAYITDIRFINLDIKNIRTSLGQRFMYTTQELLDY